MPEAEIISIDKRDLENLLRHMFLCGMNTDPLDETWVAFREETIIDFLEDYKKSGYMCYNDICGSEKHELGEE